MAYGFIYKIQFPNGKHYIGQTTCSLEKRQREHKSCAKSCDTKILYKALRKYEMVDTFELIEIDTADSLKELCEKEIGYILEYNSHYIYGNGYNMTYGGEGVNGYVPTEEDNIKNSERRKKYYEEHPEAKKAHSEKMKLYYENNPEARQLLTQYYENNPDARKEHSEKMKKYYEEHPEARQQMSEAKKKYYENPEAIQKNSEAQKKYYQDNPEARQRMSEISKKQFESEETRQQMSEIKKKHYEDNPEAKVKMSEIKKKHYEDNPEAKVKMSEISKKQWESQEARQQMSETKKNFYKNNPERKKKGLDTIRKNKPFDVFKDEKFIKTFTYQYEATEYLKKEYNITSKISVGLVLSGKRNSSAGFIFKYK